MKLVVGLAVAGLSLGLAGCESSDAIVTETPTPTLTSTVIPSTDASPSPSASGAASAPPGASPEVSGAPLTDKELLELLPDGAELRDLRGALVTATHYSEMLGTIFESGDTALWSALATSECGYCTGQAEAIDKFYASGSSAEGGRATLDPKETRGTLSEDGFAYVKTVVDLDDLFAIGADGGRENVEPAARLQLDYQLVRVGSVWHVNGVQTKPLP